MLYLKCILNGILSYSNIRNKFIEVNTTKTNKKNIVFLVGGSGLTPVLQFLFALSSSANHEPIPYDKITILCSNRNVDEILCKKELDSYAKQHPNTIKLVHTLTRKAPNNWGGEKGRISKAMIQKYVPLSSPADTVVCICGPDGFVSAMKDEMLKPLGYGESIVTLEEAFSS